jgi:hypothetical protein
VVRPRRALPPSRLHVSPIDPFGRVVVPYRVPLIEKHRVRGQHSRNRSGSQTAVVAERASATADPGIHRIRPLMVGATRTLEPDLPASQPLAGDDLTCIAVISRWMPLRYNHGWCLCREGACYGRHWLAAFRTQRAPVTPVAMRCRGEEFVIGPNRTLPPPLDPALARHHGAWFVAAVAGGMPERSDCRRSSQQAIRDRHATCGPATFTERAAARALGLRPVVGVGLPDVVRRLRTLPPVAPAVATGWHILGPLVVQERVPLARDGKVCNGGRNSAQS